MGERDRTAAGSDKRGYPIECAGSGRGGDEGAGGGG